MNIFKKIFACLMALLLLSLFVACDEGEEPDDGSAETTTVTQNADSNADDGDDSGIAVKPDATTATSGSTTATTKPTGTTSDDDVKPGDGDGDWGSYNPI